MKWLGSSLFEFCLFQDNGKPIWEARMDMETVIGAFEYFGGIAPTIVGNI